MTTRLTPREIAAAAYEPVRRYCLSRVPAHEAEDVAHAVMVKLLVRAAAVDQSRPDFDPVAWGFGLAKYTILHARRRGWRATAFTDLVGDEEQAFDPADRSADPVVADRPDRVGRVRAALSRLPRADRAILEAQFRDGRSDLETAARLGVTVAEVEARAGEAIGRVKRLLAVAS